jgi:hypothetical protein
MGWFEIFLTVAKWVTAVWVGVLAAALLGFLALGAIIAVGGWLTGAEPLWEPERPSPKTGP